MTTYILQAILFQLLFLLVYEVLLKKETFFSYNRWYLLTTAVLSLLLPFIQINALSILVPETTLTQIPTIFLPEVYIGGGAPTEVFWQVPADEIGTKSSFLNYWLLIYLAGVLGALAIVLRKYNNLSRMFRFKKIAAEGKINIIEVPNSAIACTFYRTIFLGDKLTEAEKQQILSHELVHVRQKHSLDLIFFEVLKVIFWFNPLIYIYQNRITTLHEFIADAAVVETTGKRNYYEQLLNSAFSTKNISFINQFFNHSLIKKRIVMLQKTKSKTIAKAKYIVLLPLIMLMLIYVACSNDKLSSNNPDLEKYNYTLTGGDEKSSEKDAKSYENFLLENPGYVGWRIVDHEKETIEYSIHSKDEEVPKDYNEYQYIFPNGEKSARYVKEIRTDVNTTIDKQKVNEIMERDGVVPFAVIDQVPVFQGCENLGGNQEQKKCMTEKITEYVLANFDTSLGKKLGLTGVNRVMVVFKIDARGQITDVQARAPHPDLEAEAIKVVSGLPEMTPGKHEGKNIAVSYSLPIVFQVNE